MQKLEATSFFRGDTGIARFTDKNNNQVIGTANKNNNEVMGCWQ